MLNDLERDDALLIAALKQRDESAFVWLVGRYQGSLLRLALVHARTRAVAEEIVQDTWLGVLQGIETFEGRSSFRTWLFRILVNRARTRAEREGRTVPFSALGDGAIGPNEPVVQAERFLGSTDPQWPHHWAVPPRSWGASPEEDLLTQETFELIERLVAELPPAQREVITLRDLNGCTSEEVCNVLGISETNQRVLLHRARSRVRGGLERYFDAE
ncbi:MAG TPA: RNA polymerase sigma factor [Gemmatimonadaceae bacterium]|nr:RNA polymerase sigma factor [Gemmatimonadaceae bacterium]